MLQDEGFVGVLEGSDLKANLGGQIHIRCDNANVGRQVRHDHNKIVKHMVQVSFINLADESCNYQENLVEEVVFGW